MIKIGICDDEEFFLRELKRLVDAYDWKEDYFITTFLEGQDLLSAINGDYKCDILFMDIQLKGGEKGTDIALRLKKRCPDVLVIYTSSFDCYYEDMVQAESFRFLEKPISNVKLYDALHAACERIKIKHLKYCFEYRKETYIINLNEVIYIYSVHRKVYIHLQSGNEVYFYKKLDEVEKEIDALCSCFGRANKSYLINFNKTSKITTNYVYINNMNISITEKYRYVFFDKLRRYQFG